MQDAWMADARKRATGRRLSGRSAVRIAATGIGVALLWFAALAAMGLPLVVTVAAGLFALTVSTLALAVARTGAAARRRQHEPEIWARRVGD
jgi:hypothetical protein